MDGSKIESYCKFPDGKQLCEFQTSAIEVHMNVGCTQRQVCTTCQRTFLWRVFLQFCLNFDIRMFASGLTLVTVCISICDLTDTSLLLSTTESRHRIYGRSSRNRAIQVARMLCPARSARCLFWKVASSHTTSRLLIYACRRSVCLFRKRLFLSLIFSVPRRALV